MTKLFYWPGDWLAKNTTVRMRRAIGAWLFILWVIPGLPIWLLLRNDLWFIGFMSIFALWYTGLSTVGTETPVESEVVE